MNYNLRNASCLKIGIITEVSSLAVVEEGNNFINFFYFNLKPSINMKLLPSLNDGHHYSVSFDMLVDMFLEFSGLVYGCTHQCTHCHR